MGALQVAWRWWTLRPAIPEALELPGAGLALTVQLGERSFQPAGPLVFASRAGGNLLFQYREVSSPGGERHILVG